MVMSCWQTAAINIKHRQEGKELLMCRTGSCMLEKIPDVSIDHGKDPITPMGSLVY
jgi:hypothetical protein